MSQLTNYYDYKAYSQSYITAASKGPSGIKDYLAQRVDSTQLKPKDFGSAVDCLLTRPDAFDDEYAIADLTEPTGQMAKYISYLLYMKFDHDEAYTYSQAKRKSAEDMKSEFETEWQEYYDLKTGDKFLLTQEQYDRVARSYENILNHPFTAPYFEMEYFTQVPIVFKMLFGSDTYIFKALMDMIAIDEDGNVYPIDIKTKFGGTFMRSYLDFRYDFQAYIYQQAVRSWAQSQGYEIIKDFRFLTDDLKYLGLPRIYIIPNTPEFNRNTLYGFEHMGVNYKGLVESFDDLLWYEENGWDMPRHMVENKGHIIVEYAGIRGSGIEKYPSGV